MITPTELLPSTRCQPPGRGLARGLGSTIRRLFATSHLLVAAGSRLLASLSAIAYAINGSYGWEMRANAAGRKLYSRQVREQKGDAARYELRRGIHRLEKGLVSHPRKNVFAEKYIHQVVALTERLASERKTADTLLLGWARDVLTSYFESTEATSKTDSARSRFQSISFPSPQSPSSESPSSESPSAARRQAPYRREQTPLPTSIDDLEQLARRRRSVRWFEPRPVPRALIDRAVEIARWSPSACNRQPFGWGVYEDPELVREIIQIPMGATGFVGDVPCLCVVVGQLRAFREPRDRHVIYIDAALASMALQFGLEVQGVSSCCINWPEIAKLERRMAKQLNLAADERPVMLLALGYPDARATVPYSQKKPLELIRTYNQVAAEP